MVEERLKTALLFGMPGSGKGTQGKILGSIPGFVHVSMGDVFRGLDRDSRLGRVFVDFSSRGELVPDDVTISIWKEHMRSLASQGRYDPHGQLLVLDGIPRTLAQARLLGAEIDVLLVAHLTCRNEEAMIARLRGRALKENRIDDARDDVIRRRLGVYRAETQPLLDFYPEDRIAPIEAMGTPAEVLMQLLARLALVQRVEFGNVLDGLGRR